MRATKTPPKRHKKMVPDAVFLDVFDSIFVDFGWMRGYPTIHRKWRFFTSTPQKRRLRPFFAPILGYLKVERKERGNEGVSL